MAKSTKQLVRDMKQAKQSLHLKVAVGKVLYEFDPDVFDLDHVNLPNLSEQISKIPGHIGFIVEAVGEAEKYLASVELKVESWIGVQISQFYSDYKTDKAKVYQLMTDKPEEYHKNMEELAEAKKLISIFKAYSKGMESKYQLAQTLSANIRREKDANERDYDKSATKGSLG